MDGTCPFLWMTCWTNGCSFIMLRTASISSAMLFLGCVVFFFSLDLAFFVHLDHTWHPSSVVCKLFTFQASSPKALGQLEPNLTGMFLGWPSTKFLFFVPVGYSTWLPGPIICSDWLKFPRSSSLKLMN